MSNLQIISINNLKDAQKELLSIGIDTRAVDIMAGKAMLLPIKLYSVDCPQANILKQEMLSLGGDAAISRETYSLNLKKTDVLLLGTLKQYKYLISKLNIQAFGGLKKLGCELNEALGNYIKVPPALACKSKTFALAKNAILWAY